MQAVGRRYGRYFNGTQGRTGTLWEGRYRSTLIQTERYLLACMAYIDLNPVRAGLAREAGAGRALINQRVGGGPLAHLSFAHFVARLDRPLAKTAPSAPAARQPPAPAKTSP